MKLVIKTMRSVGDRKLNRRGVQFQARFTNDPCDCADEENAMRDVARALVDDVRECGHYLCWAAESEAQHRGGGKTGGDKLTPREAALKARLVNAERIAKRQAEELRRLKLAILHERTRGEEEA